MAVLNVALIGGGLMGAFHAETLAGRLPGARLVALADPAEEPARRLLARLGPEGIRYERDYQAVLADPDVEAVAVATPGRTHPEIVTAALEAGKPVFCEKPLAHTLEGADRILDAIARRGGLLQIGFQRRFDRGYLRARELVADGALGAVHLLRSITRDPAVPPGGGVPWSIFLETLIHDFDAMRWLSGGEAVEVHAMGDALSWPRGEAGMLDTAMVLVRFATGALGTADSSFQSAYGYDVRAEVFGSGGMATVGDGRVDATWQYGPGGVARPQAHWFTELFAEAYVAELAHFVECVQTGRAPSVDGQDGRAALMMALAAIESVQTGRPARVST